MATGRFYCDGECLCSTAGADQPDELRHPTILQYGFGGRCRGGCRRFLISITTVAVAGLSYPQAVGADTARSAPPGERPDPGHGRATGISACMRGSRCCRIRRSHCSARSLWRRFWRAAEIIQLRYICRGFDLSTHLDTVLEAVARGDCTAAAVTLAGLDAALASRPGAAALRARGLILAISSALTQHSSYFDAGAPG